MKKKKFMVRHWVKCRCCGLVRVFTQGPYTKDEWKDVRYARFNGSAMTQEPFVCSNMEHPICRLRGAKMVHELIGEQYIPVEQYNVTSVA